MAFGAPAKVAVPVAAGVAAAVVFGGPIGIAVGLGAFLLSSFFGDDSKK